MKIYTYRFLWRVKDSKQINFKIITDTLAGLDQFEKSLLKLDGLELAAKEYIQEYDVDKIGRIENLTVGGESDEKNS